MRPAALGAQAAPEGVRHVRLLQQVFETGTLFVLLERSGTRQTGRQAQTKTYTTEVWSQVATLASLFRASESCIILGFTIPTTSIHNYCVTVRPNGL